MVPGRRVGGWDDDGHLLRFEERPAYDPDRPPGNDEGGVNSGDVVNAFVAQSTDGGVTWTETQVSSAGSNFGWETHGSRRVGFWGDYLYVSSVRAP